MASTPLQVSTSVVRRNKIKTFFSKPYNVILVLMGLVLTVTTVAPIVAIVEDTFKIHPGTIDAHLTGQVSGYTLVNYIDLFTSSLARTNLWEPLWNTVPAGGGHLCGVHSVRRSVRLPDHPDQSGLAEVFELHFHSCPYIMPQWTLAVVWQHMFNSNAVTGTSNGLLAATLGIEMPAWWCLGLFPSVVVLGSPLRPLRLYPDRRHFPEYGRESGGGSHHPGHSKVKIMFRVTLPMVKPAILSTILLVFGSSMGSYPVPHYLNLTTLATKYGVHELQIHRRGQHPGHHHDDLRRGHHAAQPAEPPEPEKLHHRHRKIRADLQDQPGPGGQICHCPGAGRGDLFHQASSPIVSFAFETFLPNPATTPSCTPGTQTT